MLVLESLVAVLLQSNGIGNCSGASVNVKKIPQKSSSVPPDYDLVEKFTIVSYLAEDADNSTASQPTTSSITMSPFEISEDLATPILNSDSDTDDDTPLWLVWLKKSIKPGDCNSKVIIRCGA